MPLQTALAAASKVIGSMIHPIFVMAINQTQIIIGIAQNPIIYQPYFRAF